jgi:MFS family permease
MSEKPSSPEGQKVGAYGWYVVGLLAVANGISFLDRGFINLVIDPIKQTLSVSDTQMALLVGPAFLIFYSTVSLPLGRIADRFNRKRLMLAGILFWSTCTALFGFARNFATLAVARMGVGLGEAALVPAGVSILSDRVPREKLGRAVSTFTAGGILGGASAALLGGVLMHWLTRAGPIKTHFGIFQPWQTAFLIISVPGVIVALLMAFTLKEPVRRRAAGEGVPKVSLGETLRYLWGRRSGTLFPMLGFAFISTASGVSTWMATYYIRTFGLTPAQVGPIMGITSLVIGFPAAVLGGYLADRLRRGGREDANILVAVAALALEIPLSLLILNAPNAVFAFIVAAPSSFLLIMAFGVAHPAMALTVPSHMRSQAVALYLLCANTVGLGIVPLAIALMTDYVFKDPLALRYSMTIAVIVFVPLAVIFMLAFRKKFITQVEAVRDEEAAAAGLQAS